MFKPQFRVQLLIIAVSIFLAIGVFLYYSTTYPAGYSQTSKFTQSYALIALFFCYLTLLINPFIQTFSFIPHKKLILNFRAPFLISTFFFAFLHGCFAFFKQLGGFEGLFFLNEKYLFAISLSFVALIVLFFASVASFHIILKNLPHKLIHFLNIFVSISFFLIIIHALMLGGHFTNIASFMPQIFFIAIGFYLLLLARQYDHFLRKKFSFLPQFGVSVLSISLILLLFFGYSIYLRQNNTSVGFDIHAQHIQLAIQAQNPSSNSQISKIPGLSGDRTRRYSVSFVPPIVQPNQDAILLFRVTDASNGSPVRFFTINYTKIAHFIIVDSTLTYFNHIHPDLTEDGFAITTQFPKTGTYHLYLDFVPTGGIEQQFGFIMNVGNAPQPPLPSTQNVDTNLTKIIGDYEVTLNTHGLLKASALSIGGQRLSFTIKDAKTKQPIKTLKPYLASFGHLVMINQNTYTYLHVHPTNLKAPPPNANSGPTVDFLPLGIYGPIKPGIYRVFAQFNPNNQLILAEYTVKVE